MVRVIVFNAHPRCRMGRAEVITLVRRVLQHERRKDATVSVVFVDGRSSARINRKYLGHAGSTDVISFSLGEGKTIEGEVYVNLDRARAQAPAYGATFVNEVHRLVVHGTLHLVGYDDRTARLRHNMRRREDRYVGVSGTVKRREGTR